MSAMPPSTSCRPSSSSKAETAEQAQCSGTEAAAAMAPEPSRVELEAEADLTRETMWSRDLWYEGGDKCGHMRSDMTGVPGHATG